MNTQNKKKELFDIIFNSVMACLYLGLFFYAIFGPKGLRQGSAQGRITLMQSIGALAICASPFLLKWWFRLELSAVTQIGVQIFAFLAIFLGEGFTFYYRYSWWDDLLHSSSGFLLAIVGYGLSSQYAKKHGIEKHALFSAVCAFFFSIGCALLWEIYEFTGDTLFGMNMQKTIPEAAALWNGGNSFAEINGTDAEIAAFFRTNYRYAIMDTMSDLLEGTGGALLFAVLSPIFAKAFGKNGIRIFTYTKKEEVKEPESNPAGAQ